MCGFGIPVFEDRKNYWNDKIQSTIVGRRKFTDDERAQMFLMGARGDYHEFHAFAEKNGIDRDFANDKLLNSHINKAAFTRMWILLPELTETLMATCLTNSGNDSRKIDEEIFVAYSLMASLVDRFDRGATKSDGSVNTHFLYN